LSASRSPPDHTTVGPVDTTRQKEFTATGLELRRTMRIRPRFLKRRRQERRERRNTKRRHEIEKQAAQRTALRGRDEHTGGYGDPTYPGP
jgi:hypothetical protein